MRFTLYLALLLATLHVRAATVSFSNIPSTNTVNSDDLLLLDSHLGGTNYATRTITISQLPGTGTGNMVGSGTSVAGNIPAYSDSSGTALVPFGASLGTNAAPWLFRAGSSPGQFHTNITDNGFTYGYNGSVNGQYDTNFPAYYHAFEDRWELFSNVFQSEIYDVWYSTGNTNAFRPNFMTIRDPGGFCEQYLTIDNWFINNHANQSVYQLHANPSIFSGSADLWGLYNSRTNASNAGGFKANGGQFLAVATDNSRVTVFDDAASTGFGHPVIFDQSGSHAYDFELWGFRKVIASNQPIEYNLASTSADAPTISSGATIAPTKRISFVSGTTTIDTITAPSPISATGGEITLIPTGLWSTSTSGNIALATTAVTNKALIMTYDHGTGKWYPSY